MQKAIQFLKSYNFTKGLLISFAAFSAIAICYFFFNMTIGIGAAFGVLIACFSDIPGNKKHNVYGILISLLIAIVSYITIHLTIFNLYFLIPALVVLIFINSYISVYGFRASLIAFSGLVGVALSFAHPLTGIEIFYNAFYILLGGLWYLLISLSFETIRTKQYSDELLTDCMELTANYLNTRVALFYTTDRENVLNKQLQLQNELNEKHEALRNLLLAQRLRSGATKSKQQQLLIFIELIDILEFAVANPFNYSQFDQSSGEFQKTALQIGQTMEAVADRLFLVAGLRLKNKKIQPSDSINKMLKEADEAIERFKSAVDIKTNRDGILILRNLYDYTKRQHEKVTAIEKIINNDLTNEVSIIKRTDRLRFLTSQNYSYKIFLENLSLKSPIFKHSLRLVVTVLLGYAIGSIFSLQNAYWIILTIIVIMRPGYVLTKERSRQRILGTLIGGAIAVGIVLLTNNMVVYIVITFIAMTLSFTFIQQNYKASAVYITLTIIFVYAMLYPDAISIIQYRIIDTLVGAGLASITNLLLWPAWESQNIKSLIAETVKTNRNYLKEVNKLYASKEKAKTSYKISRKNAFIAIGNLHAGFQRMTQEPKNKQRKLDQLYQIVVTQNTLLSATASLGTYIQIHHTTDASEYFTAYITAIDNELFNGESVLFDVNSAPKQPIDLADAKRYLKQIFDELSAERDREIDEGKLQITVEQREFLKEVRIISEQLEWLHKLSLNLYAAIENYVKQ
ncbi:FUSC family protein [Galbibacter mesophilus]|uniref:FUSC family protein n=1 Tax=Galbibacter mesophilus TaxID=379069 RepID=UPI00191F7882|nr:FUSC family membrane protein [Galbibacter mesophilus]MCM5664140.1 FUSC family protein [Galbibacter mesophilus]